MQVPRRAASLLATVLVVATTFLSLIASPAAATTGRDSPSSAADCQTGPWEGLYDLGSYVENAPFSEDYYRCPVSAGQMLQVSLWGAQAMYGTVNRNINGTLVELYRDYTSNIRNVQVVNLGMAELDFYAYASETLYIKVSPPGMPANTRFYYNIYIRTVNLTVLEAGTAFSPNPDANSIHGWDYAQTYFFGMNFVSDFYLINASDLGGGNHRNYRVDLTQTCATAIIDIFLYQWLDFANQRLDILNHSYSMQRRLDRGATTTIAPTFDFSPALYDGYYLLRVRAAENGTYDAETPTQRYRYTVSVNTVGGYAKDGNDRPGQGPTYEITGEHSGRIDTRDDPVDWINVRLLANDQASLSVSLTRPNSQDFTNLGLRYRVLVVAPNGTIIDDVDNWGFTGMGFPYYNPYLTVPSFRVYENGSYKVGLFTADASLDTAMQRENSGGLGRNWADYRINFGLPNRAPVVSALPDLVFDEDTVQQLQLLGFVSDPEMKPGYPLCGLGTPSVNLTTRMQGCLLTVTPKADWNGQEQVNVTFSDDFPGNKVTVRINVTVRPVNDAPRVRPGAAADFTTIHVNEDGSTTVPMTSIFEDVDSPVVTFTTSGVSGTKVNVTINDISLIATITPNLNFNGQVLMSWIATDDAFQASEFPSTLIVDALNDPPRATDTRLPRIVFDEGRDFLINLTSHFYESDTGDSLRYYGAVDASVADFIRVNNSNLNPSDPNMRVYVVDQYRSDYFTNAPIPIRFWVFDSKNNLDESSGQTLAVEKSTFLEIVNVNDGPIVDEVQPLPEEVAIESYEEGDSITFAITRVKDPDNTFYPGTDAQFFYKWYVNDNEIIGQTGPTYVFRTVLDATQAGQWDAGNYSVYVQVFDAAGAKAAQEPAWNFEVAKKNREPSVQVVKPTTSTLQVEEGTEISFKALVSDDDPEDSEGLLITWRITGEDGKERILGTGDELAEQLDPGVYRVRVTVDDGQTIEQREFRVTVTPHEFNTPGFEAAGAAIALIGAAAVAVMAGRERRRN